MKSYKTVVFLKDLNAKMVKFLIPVPHTVSPPAKILFQFALVFVPQDAFAQLRNQFGKMENA